MDHHGARPVTKSNFRIDVAQKYDHAPGRQAQLVRGHTARCQGVEELHGPQVFVCLSGGIDGISAVVDTDGAAAEVRVEHFTVHIVDVHILGGQDCALGEVVASLFQAADLRDECLPTTLREAGFIGP